MKRLIFLLVALAVLCGAYFRLREARDAEEEAIARADVKRMLENFARQRDFLDSLSPEKRAIELLKLQSREATTPPYPDLEMINNETPQPPTLWREAETKRYAALFDGTKVDLLVVPFQVQGFAIERSQRSLMTGLLSSALSKSAQRLANPSWVAKALGDGDRRIDRDAVFRLASAIGAQRILWTYVGHKDATFLHLYFQFQERNKDGSFSETPDLPGKLIADIGFDDENPPILAFQKNLKKIIGMLGYDFSETLPLPAKNLDTAFPADFAAMLQMKDPANSAQQLQLLAHLLPEDAWREKERLFERSLLLAWQFSPEHPSARRLLARAYYGLGMRPSALAAIQSPQNDVERALAALLNGNLPDLENYRSLIPNSPERLMAEIDVVDVRFAYEKPQGKDTDDFISDLPNVLKHFSQRRIADADPVKLRRFNNFQILQFLGEEFPSAGQGITQLLRGKRIAGQRMGSEEIDLLLANYLDPRLAFPEPSSHGTSLSWALNKLDILEFLSQSALANLIYAADRMARTQAVYTSAIDYIDGIGPLFGSHPEILAARAYAEHHGPAQQLSGEARKDLIAQNTKNIGLSTYWLSMSHDHHASDRPTSSLSNATYGAWLLEKFFRDVRDTAEKEKLLKETKDRFSGSGMRELLTAELRESEGNSEAAKAALQTAIHANITKKTVYVRLGELLMREGRYSEAADVFASFPGMDKKGYSLSSDNFAYVTGSRFFQLGETDLSKPFFKIASASHTGSGASMMSAVRLALLDDDYAAALQHLYGTIRRYPTSHRFRDYFSLLHLVGEYQAAWDGFLVVAENSSEPHLWDSVLVGHRRMRYNDAQIVDYLEKMPLKNKDNLKNRYLTLAATMDRIPGQTLIDAARKATDVTESESHFIEAYRALKEGDYQKSSETFRKIKSLWSFDHRYMLSYYAIAAAKSGGAQDFDKELTERYERVTKTADANWKEKLAFDHFLSKSVLAALSSKPEEAEKLFMRAFHDRIFTERRGIGVEYQMTEIASLLFELTDNRRFQEIALRLARANQKTQPWESWSHAFLAVHSDKKDEREASLSRAVYLDPQSDWLSRLPKKERDRALEKTEKSPPFKLSPKSPKERV